MLIFQDILLKLAKKNGHLSFFKKLLTKINTFVMKKKKKIGSFKSDTQI